MNLLLTFFGNMNHLPIRLTSISFSRHLSSFERFGERLTKLYVFSWSAVFAVASFILSLDVVGCPYEVLDGLWYIVKSIFVYPVITWSRYGRSDAFSVLKTGLLEFPQRILYLFFLVVSNITSVVSRALTLITLDQNYVREHAQKVYASKLLVNPRQGLGAGMAAMFDGVYNATSGLIDTPHVGWMANRYRGLAVGLLLGLIGLPTKIAIGVLDLIAKVSEGFKNTLSLRADSHRQRAQKPLVVQRDGLVRPFDEDVSNAFHLLSLCQQLQGGENEFYIKHHRIDTQTYGGAIQQRVLLITTSRVVFGSLDPLQVNSTNARSFAWTYDLHCRSDLRSLSLPPCSAPHANR